MKSMMLLAAVLALGPTSEIHAQDADIAAGKAYAEAVCAKCHAVLAGEDLSSEFGATPFQELAERPGMTEYALSVWLQTSHPTMPDIVLEQDEMRNVIAYIRSLDRRP
ncbi:c-type cytochrome [Methyloceanibacter caenitepidi]|uniref:Cytochrome c552 n=1 Tax=Methyloceanibacter caenitepidi TaxID=1384459 RepID=A0A0A8JYN7_9HYPH|nr:c-type cytochrome [Methyloceanibacter caenitepidi]BAQ15546.1 cytochrome c552 [Methyloceanibacter caenitepidi]